MGDTEVPWQPIPDCRGLRIRRCFRHFRLGPFDCRSLLGATAALFPELLFAASTPPTLGMVKAKQPGLAFSWRTCHAQFGIGGRKDAPRPFGLGRDPDSVPADPDSALTGSSATFSTPEPDGGGAVSLIAKLVATCHIGPGSRA